jgi:hypothetical protein
MMLRELFRTPPPDVAVEIAQTHVSAARMAWRGGESAITAHAAEPLPAGAVTPALAAFNIPEVPVVAQAVGRVLAELGAPKPSRVALIVPDTVAKVSLLKLETVPSKARDLQEIVRWQVRKTAPFPMEQAVLSISSGALAPDGASEFVVSFARADVIHQYEQACVMAGAHPGLVDLATFGVINSVLAGPSAPAGDWLLVHVTGIYLTLAVVRERALLFFRHRSDEAEGTVADLIHQTAMYYEDRLSGGGFARVLVAGAARLPGGGAESVRRLGERLGVTVEAVDPRSAAALQDRIAASPELLDRLAPLVGLLMRERRAA